MIYLENDVTPNTVNFIAIFLQYITELYYLLIILTIIYRVEYSTVQIYVHH